MFTTFGHVLIDFAKFVELEFIIQAFNYSKFYFIKAMINTCTLASMVRKLEYAIFNPILLLISFLNRYF